MVVILVKVKVIVTRNICKINIHITIVLISECNIVCHICPIIFLRVTQDDMTPCKSTDRHCG